MGKDIRASIIKTLVYADVFDYSLKKEEVWRFLISKKPVSQKQAEKVLSNFNSKNGYYHLKNRKSIVAKRKIREKESLKKLAKVKKIAWGLSMIPYINLIGVSGNLAMNNAQKNDDIDLFIITKKNTLWTTRFLLIAFLKILNSHRGRFSKKVSDKICVNMFLDERKLTFPKTRQDLYTAHEIVQMVPVFNRKLTYEKFIGANKWVKEYLPNSMGRIRNQELGIRAKEKKPLFIIHNSLFIFESVAKIFQLWHMKNFRTSELISDTMLAFHPKDYKHIVLQKYQENLKLYEKI